MTSRDGAAPMTSRDGVASAHDGSAPLVCVRGLEVAVRGRGRGDAGKEVLRGMDLDVPAGSRIGIVGESGSGKTTCSRAIAGLLGERLVARGGSIGLDGTEILALGERERRRVCSRVVAMIPQDAIDALNPYESVLRQMEDNVRLHRPGVTRSHARELALRRVADVRLRLTADELDHRPSAFSGGMRQRLAIAMALEAPAKLLVADEPTTSLDAVNQEGLLDLIDGVCSERGMALLYISHNLGLVARTCETVVVMRDGRVIERGPTREVLSAPRDPYAARLVAATRDLLGEEGD